ncbi:putative dihydrodipicolinate reductase 3, chloroplastic [Hordeum vulgare]|nr:putative dihydrodipicolinate reductase 3, chloroplastic [Hordeum vulgare]
MGGHGNLNLLPRSTTRPLTGGTGTGTVGSSPCRYSVHYRNASKVVIVGATKEKGRAAIAVVSRARGMELAGAINTQCIGMDAGELTGMDEALEIPVLNDLTMVLGSIAQTRATGVVVDFSEPSSVYDNVKQAAAFGLSSVVYIPKIEMDTITELSAFCDKASMGCLVAPTLSIGSVLLQQAAIQASFHYNNVEIVESRPNPSDLPSPDAIQIANNISDLGQIYNRQDMDSDNPARGQVLGEDGVRVHSMVLPGLASSTSVVLSGPGEVYTLKHDVTDVQSLMPGLILGNTEGDTVEELDLWPGEVLVGNGQLTYHENSFFFEEEINGIKSIPRLIIRNTATRKADPRTLRNRHTVLERSLAPHIR